MEDGPGVHQRLGGAEELLYQIQALYCTATSAAGRVVLVQSTYLPSKRASASTLAISNTHRASLHLQEPAIAPVSYHIGLGWVQAAFP